MNHGDGAQHRDDPEHRSHAIEQCSDDDEHDAFGALHESGLATGNKRFGAGAGVAHHHGADHDKRRHHHVEEPIGAGVVNQKTEEQGNVTVAVDDGIEETAELGDLVGGAGHAAVHHVEDARTDDYEPGVEKHALLVVGVGEAKQEGCDDVDQQADEGKGVGRNVSESQAVDNLVEQPLAGPSDCARPGHYASSWIVVSFRTSSSRLPLGVTTSLTSPTFLPSSARPMGEVVEIRPLVTSDSSLVTSLYSISSPLKESNTSIVEPIAALYLGMLAMLTSDRSAMRFFS